MYVHISAIMSTRVCAYIQAHTRPLVYVCRHAQSCPPVYSHMSVIVPTGVHKYSCDHAHMCMHKQVWLHVHMHVHSTYNHAYISIYTGAWPCSHLYVCIIVIMTTRVCAHQRDHAHLCTYVHTHTACSCSQVGIYTKAQSRPHVYVLNSIRMPTHVC